MAAKRKTLRQKRLTADRGNRVIIYVRISSITGREDTYISDEMQEKVGRDYCEAQGLEVIDVIKDIDLSGTSSDKRQIGAIIKRIEDDEADGVVVWKISRWGRDLLDSLKNILDLRQAGGFIRSTEENLENIETPEGSFSLEIMLSVAQLQSRQIGKTWQNIHLLRVSKGLPATGGARFGYDYTPRVDKVNWGGYTRNGDTAPILRELYLKYIGGMNWPTLVKWLDGKGCKTVRGSNWGINALTRMMDSGFGAGKLAFGSAQGYGIEHIEWLPGAQPSVITEEEWEAYKARRGNKKPPREKNPTSRLSGLVRCATCERKMYNNKGWWKRADGTVMEKPYMICHRHPRFRRSTSCPDPVRISTAIVEAKVRLWIEENANNVDAAELTMQARAKQEVIQGDADRIRKDIARLQKRLSNAREDRADRIMSAENYKEVETSTEAQIKDLQKSLGELDREVAISNIPSPTSFKALAMAWEKMSTEQFNAGLREMIDHINIKPALDSKRPSNEEAMRRIDIVPRWAVVRPTP